LVHKVYKVCKVHKVCKVIKEVGTVKIERFEDLKCWQEGKKSHLRHINFFKLCRDYLFRDQIQRAVLSIMNNIAEGFERQTNKELRNFLFIAKGSCGEFRSMLYVADELGYISKQEFLILSERALIISKMLSSFIKTL